MYSGLSLHWYDGVWREWRTQRLCKKWQRQRKSLKSWSTAKRNDKFQVTMEKKKKKKPKHESTRIQKQCSQRKHFTKPIRWYMCYRNRTKTKRNTQTSTRKSISSNACTAYWQYKQSIHKSKNTGCNIFVSSARTYSHASFLISPYNIHTYLYRFLLLCFFFFFCGAIRPNSNEFQCATVLVRCRCHSPGFVLFVFLIFVLSPLLLSHTIYNLTTRFTPFAIRSIYTLFANTVHSSHLLVGTAKYCNRPEKK